MKPKLSWNTYCYENFRSGDIQKELSAYFWSVNQNEKGGKYSHAIAQGYELTFENARRKVEKLVLTSTKASKVRR